MDYKQTKAFNQKLAGTKPGYCLQNNRLGYSIPAKYATAAIAWAHTQQHKNRSIPSGVTTPLFYTYKTAGHVNEHLSDGRVWSDGTTYASLDDYLSKHPLVKYLGWGESINDVRVLQPVPSHTETVKPGTWNVRSTNSTSGSILGHVSGGMRFETVIVGSSWRKITFNGRTGYVGPAAF